MFEDFNGSYAATQHLIGLGHRSIGYIGGDARHSSNYARWQGHLEDPGGTEKPPVFVEINFELVLRGSTGPPRREALAVHGHFAGAAEQHEE